jgi:hypothetical protein
MLFLRRTASHIRPALSEIDYLFAAAVVNSQFRRLLLENPRLALKNGYQGQVFDLSLEEQEQVTSAEARSLADLAKTVMNS